MKLELAGKRALVTGGASGIGAAVVARLVDEGSRVLVGDRDATAAAGLAERYGDAVRFVLVDVTSDDAWDRLAAETREWLGGLDVLVNCAGIAHHKHLADESFAEYRGVVEVNQFGTFRAIKAAAALMADGGSVVTIASINTDRGMRDSISYAASKAAVVAMTRCAAHDLARQGIRVNTVSPGVVGTPMSAERADTDLGAGVDRVLGLPGRMATADEVAVAITFLASPVSGYITGADLLVDGGVTLLGAGSYLATEGTTSHA